jgi:hypothetical protein
MEHKAAERAINGLVMLLPEMPDIQMSFRGGAPESREARSRGIESGMTAGRSLNPS